MQNIVWIILGIVGGIVLAYFAFGRKKGANSDEQKDQKDLGLNLILTQINELSRTVDNKLGQSQKEVN